jgi:hypothetical protein
MNERDVVQLHYGGKWRPAILLEWRGDYALVLCLTGGAHPNVQPQIAVRNRQRRWYRELRLTKPSFLYPGNVAIVRKGAIRPSERGGKCPIDLLDRIQAELLPAVAANDEKPPA